jgi:hypothetical protein
MLNLPKTPSAHSKQPPARPGGPRVPTPEEIVMLSPPLTRCSIKLGKALAGLSSKWVISGNASEIMMGVNLQADDIVILTTKDGCEEICRRLSDHKPSIPNSVQTKLGRDADVGGTMHPVYIKSNYAELFMDNVKVKIHGDLQIKVGEWEWGDPLDWEAQYTNITGVRIPIMPMVLKSELYLGLGWLDRMELISEATHRAHAFSG